MDNPKVLSGSFVATGQSISISIRGGFNVSLWGTFAATVRLERSFDNGTTWLPLSDAYGTSISWNAPVSLIGEEPEYKVIYRFNCTSFTSGTVNYRLSL